MAQIELSKASHHIGLMSFLWPASRGASTVSMTQSKRWRAVAAASLGNALEWFDFVIYGYFATTIAKLFFPSKSDLESLLIALATFGITSSGRSARFCLALSPTVTAARRPSC